MRFLSARHGTFRKMQKNWSVPIKGKINRLLCWIFCKSRRKVDAPVESQITWYHNIALMDKVKNNVVAEYFLKDISEPIGVSE